MEDMDDSESSTGAPALFIQEEDGELKGALREERLESGITFSGPELKEAPALMKPYLEEMDELLKSCEELTDIHFGSHYSSLTKTSFSESNQSRGDVTMENYTEINASPQAYLSTSYLDTQVPRAGTEDQGECSSSGCGAMTGASALMPLTSAGNKLSDSMVEYEGQLTGMLAMLEGCMEEAGMDYEPQDWATDANQEYVHISKNTNIFTDTTLMPLDPGVSIKQESQTMSFESFADQDDTVNKVFEESRSGPPQSSLFSGNDIGSMSAECQERMGGTGVCVKFETDQAQMPLESTENDNVHCEEMKTGYLSTKNEDKTGFGADSTGLPAEERQDFKMDILDVRRGGNDLDVVGSQLEECIEEVQHLERRRKELLAEVIELRGNEGQEDTEEETEENIDGKVTELMKAIKKEEKGRREERKREIQNIQQERAEEEKRLWKANLERQGLQDELRKLKKRLFAMARDCAHNQAALNSQHRHVELLKREEEKLQSLVAQLTEERSQLQTVHQQQLLGLQAELQATSSSQVSNTQEELTECRRHSCGDIQQYLQGGLKALEQRYEPILLALLKRREAAAAALVKAKEQAQELKGQLSPLREEIQKLKLQRACLEEKLKLIHFHRRENVGQYKETVYYLEECSRELRTELNIQKKNTKDMEKLKESLNKQLLMYRSAIENHNKNHEERT